MKVFKPISIGTYDDIKKYNLDERLLQITNTLLVETSDKYVVFKFHGDNICCDYGPAHNDTQISYDEFLTIDFEKVIYGAYILTASDILNMADKNILWDMTFFEDNVVKYKKDNANTCIKNDIVPDNTTISTQENIDLPKDYIYSSIPISDDPSDNVSKIIRSRICTDSGRIIL